LCHFRQAVEPTSFARLIGQWLSGRLGQPFVIENRPGVSTNIGTEAIVRAIPDGYSLLLVASVNAINATLYDKLSFNFIRDIAPVASIIRQPLIMLVNPSVPAKTVPEFIAYAKANPDQSRADDTSPGQGYPLVGVTLSSFERVNRKASEQLDLVFGMS
jgi:tripartite-type tricarboxylate transporter receptor subunit TctC